MVDEKKKSVETVKDGEVKSSQTGLIQNADAVKDGDNSLLDDDEAYVGVAGEYRNAAYPEKYGPLRSEDEDAAAFEEVAKAAEIERAIAAEEIGFQGFKTDATHPSEKKNLADEAFKNNQTRYAESGPQDGSDSENKSPFEK